MVFKWPARNDGSNSKGLLLREAFVVSYVTPSKLQLNVLLYSKYWAKYGTGVQGTGIIATSDQVAQRYPDTTVLWN